MCVRKILEVVERVLCLHIISETIYISKDFWIKHMIGILWFTLKTESETTIWNNSYRNNLLLVKRAIQWRLSNPDANNPDALSSGRTLLGTYFSMLFCISNSEFQDPCFLATDRCYQILPIRHKTLSNQSINRSIHQSIKQAINNQSINQNYNCKKLYILCFKKFKFKALLILAIYFLSNLNDILKETTD